MEHEHHLLPFNSINNPKVSIITQTPTHMTCYIAYSKTIYPFIVSPCILCIIHVLCFVWLKRGNLQLPQVKWKYIRWCYPWLSSQLGMPKYASDPSPVPAFSLNFLQFWVMFVTGPGRKMRWPTHVTLPLSLVPHKTSFLPLHLRKCTIMCWSVLCEHSTPGITLYTVFQR